jgi:PAS domain S-box-containing protein
VRNVSDETVRAATAGPHRDDRIARVGARVAAGIATLVVLVAGIAIAVVQSNVRSDILSRFRPRAEFPVQVTAKAIGESIRGAGASFGQALSANGGRLSNASLAAAANTIVPGNSFTLAYSPDGHVLAAAPPPARKFGAQVPPALIALAAKPGSKGWITDVVSGAAGCPCVDYLIPVQLHGQPVIVRAQNSLVAFEGFLIDILRSAPTVPGGSALVLDGQSRIISSSRMQPLGGPAPARVAAAAVRGGTGKLSVNGKPSRYTAQPVPLSRWHVIVTAPESELLSGTTGFALIGPWLLFAVLVLTALGTGILWRRLGRTADALADRERRYRTLVEQLPAIVYLAEFPYDGDPVWHYVSPELENVLGYSPEQWTADPTLWAERLDQEERSKFLAEKRRACETGRDVYGTYRLRAADERIVWIRDEATVLSEEGRALVQGVMYDVTQLKATEYNARSFAEALQETVAERTAELERSRRDTLQRLALAAEYRDDATLEHTERVGRVAELIGRKLGLDAETAQTLRDAAPLHDLGKLAVSDRILLKPGKLTPEERTVISAHPVVGARILAGGGDAVMQMAEEIALTHHERWDGTGYPRHLKGEEIPIVGRIVAVADVLDALIHERPYKPAYPLDDAIEMIRGDAGSHFDPAVVEAFLQLDANELRFELERAAAGRELDAELTPATRAEQPGAR